MKPQCFECFANQQNGRQSIGVLHLCTGVRYLFFYIYGTDQQIRGKYINSSVFSLLFRRVAVFFYAGYLEKPEEIHF